MAIDRQSLIDNVTKGGQIPATSFAPPGIFGAPPPGEVGQGTDPELAKSELQSYLDENGMTVDDLNAMQQVEGDHLAADFAQRLELIEETVSTIESESEGLVERYRERLEERIAKLTGGMVEIDEGRIAQEAAFLADRSDIDEEIVRARSHVKQFREIMDGPEPGGRKLNFLLQEFNREFNTMGSKTGNTSVSHRIVAVKSELEKLREQVQNVE